MKVSINQLARKAEGQAAASGLLINRSIDRRGGKPSALNRRTQPRRHCLDRSIDTWLAGVRHSFHSDARSQAPAGRRFCCRRSRSEGAACCLAGVHMCTLHCIGWPACLPWLIVPAACNQSTIDRSISTQCILHLLTAPQAETSSRQAGPPDDRCCVSESTHTTEAVDRPGTVN